MNDVKFNWNDFLQAAKWINDWFLCIYWIELKVSFID